MAACKLERRGIIPAVAIAGHHAGLGYLINEPSELRQMMAADMQQHPERFSDANCQRLFERFTVDGMELPKVIQGLKPAITHAADMLDVRMFFSALVDADYLETEAHFNGNACFASCHAHDMTMGGTVYQANSTTTASSAQIGVWIDGTLFTTYA